MDAEFILVSNDTKDSIKKRHQLAEKWQFFQRVIKADDLGQSAKGGPFAKFPN